MRDRLIVVLTTSAFLLLVCAGLSQTFGQTAAPKPSAAGVFYTAEAAATVETVDPQARQILLRLPDSSLVTLNAGPQLKNLDQFKPGDHVMVRYIEAAAVDLTKSNGAAAQAFTRSNSQIAGRGTEMHGTGKVLAVDNARNTVSFTGPDNKVQTIIVQDPSMLSAFGLQDVENWRPDQRDLY
jgi:hypothetical protein